MSSVKTTGSPGLPGLPGLLLAVLLLLVWVLTAGLPALAGTVTPGVAVRQEYLDNILFSDTNQQADLITVVSPTLLLEKRTERLTAWTKMRVAPVLYLDNDQLNDTEKSVRAVTDFRLTERLSLGGDGAWSRASLRGTDLETTGLLLTGDREKTDLSLSADLRLSEISGIGFSAGYGRSDIRRASEDEDNDRFSLSLDYTRDISRHWPNTGMLAGFRYFRYDTEIRDETLSDYRSDTFQLLLGVDRDLTERTGFYTRAGLAHVRSEERILNGTDESSDDSVTALLSAGLHWTGETRSGKIWTADVSAAHDVREGTGTNGTVERTSANFNLSAGLTQAFSAGLKTACYLNRNERSLADDIRELTVYFQPGFRYELDRELVFTGGYRFTTTEDRTADSSTVSNLLFFELTKTFELE